MFDNERDFSKAIAGMKIDTTPNLAHKERLRGQLLAEFKAAGAAVGARPVHSGLGTAVKLSVAAAVVVAAAVGVRHIGPRDSGAASILEPVKLATLNMPWVHATVTEYRDEGDRTNEQWNDTASKATYIQAGGGFVFCSQYGQAPQQLVYNPRARAVVRSKLPATGFFGAESAYTLVDAVSSLVAKAKASVQTWDDFYECRAVQVYEVEKARPGFRFRGQAVGRLRIKLMADPESNRLVAARVEYEDDGGARLAREEWTVDYPQSGPESIYDLGVPRSARLIDATAQPIGTPMDQPRPISTPGEPARY